MQDKEKDKWTIKDKLEIAEAIFTIVVSVMAIWGTIVAWENGFWHKLNHVIGHLHLEYNVKEDAARLLQNVEKKIDVK